MANQTATPAQLLYGELSELYGLLMSDHAPQSLEDLRPILTNTVRCTLALRAEVIDLNQRLHNLETLIRLQQQEGHHGKL